MNWKSFKTMLEQYPAFNLQFKYAENQWVNAAYHITEIKQGVITSVDCGGVVNNWTEVIIQLLEPGDQQTLKPMKVHKALSIIAAVEKALPLTPDAIVKIEFGNAAFNTRQLIPDNITVQDEDLIVDLQPDTVQCKAQERGGSCGPAPSGDECCVQPRSKLINLTQNNACCTADSGCCS